MIVRTLFRILWVVVAFFLAALAAIIVLFALGAIWAGDEIRAADPNHPMVRHGGQAALGFVVFAGTVAPALNALPALLAVIVGEILRIRSWMYYVLAGGASLAAVPLLIAPTPADLPSILASQYLTIFAAAGFAGGFIYWLLAGARA
ncbi:MAG: hypothetical protein JJE37_00800 [Methyloceanibacter sp.]|nr:hypothetical protein [Methyloceanibacter sp.]